MKKRLLCFMLTALFCFGAAAPVNAASSDAEKRESVAAYAPEETDTLISNMTDIDADAYYADAVEWALENGVTKGTTVTTFSPDDTCTRGQVVTFLWRAEGSPEPSSLENPFEDVAESAYFYKAVLWAVEQGITNGTSETAFSPSQKCSQAHILTFICCPFSAVLTARFRLSGSVADGRGTGLFHIRRPRT